MNKYCQAYAIETRTEDKYTSNFSEITIVLTDINDNSPVFEKNELLVYVGNQVAADAWLGKVTDFDNITPLVDCWVYHLSPCR